MGKDRRQGVQRAAGRRWTSLGRASTPDKSLLVQVPRLLGLVWRAASIPAPHHATVLIQTSPEVHS